MRQDSVDTSEDAADMQGGRKRVGCQLEAKAGKPALGLACAMLVLTQTPDMWGKAGGKRLLG